MSFDQQKQNALNKDKSNKGSIDKPILKTINLINSFKNYYTTSSCAGRIILIKVPKTGKKNEAEFILRKHSKVNFKEIKNNLHLIKEPIWFRQEPVIMHACAKTLKDALKILSLARSVGFKRSGIITYSKRIIIEILSTEYISAIVSKDNRILVTDDYLKILIEEANQNLTRTRTKLEKFHNSLKTLR